jgi:hypothetical protein
MANALALPMGCSHHFFPLLLSIPHIRDLEGGVGRQYMATIPDEAGDEPMQYEQLWLPYTDRVLE